MDCRTARALMGLVLDDASPAVRTGSALGGHLRVCSSCAAEWGGLSAVHTLLRSSVQVEAPPGFADATMRRVVHAAGRRAMPRVTTPARSQAVAMLYAAVGLWAAVLGCMLVLVRIGSPKDLVAQAALVAHAAQAQASALATPTLLSAAAVSLYLAVAVAVAVAWFGALVLPRQPVRLDNRRRLA